MVGVIVFMVVVKAVKVELVDGGSFVPDGRDRGRVCDVGVGVRVGVVALY